jgi:hypothetical protein
MTPLRENISVRCSAGEAESRIESYFTSLKSGNGVAHIRLRVPVDFADSTLGLSVDRELRIDALRTHDDDRNDVIRVTWASEGRTAFPRFEGALVVWGEDDPGQSYIELDGSYEAPIDGTGKALDAIIGDRLARSAARQFLGELKRAIEAPCA